MSRTSLEETLATQRAYRREETAISDAKALLMSRMGDTQARGTVDFLLQHDPVAKSMYEVSARTVARLLPFPMHQFTDQYAGIGDMLDWAGSIMAREPDFVIGGDYMHRWYILPRNAMMNLYLHKTFRSDGDVMHDHPWDNTSMILSGGYREETPEGNFIRRPGDVIHRKATDVHRLVLLDDQPSVSLFMTGPKVRDWGFHCPGGWVPWEVFTGGYHDGRSDKGAGCGELG